MARLHVLSSIYTFSLDTVKKKKKEEKTKKKREKFILRQKGVLLQKAYVYI